MRKIILKFMSTVTDIHNSNEISCNQFLKIVICSIFEIVTRQDNVQLSLTTSKPEIVLEQFVHLMITTFVISPTT